MTNRDNWTDDEFNIILLNPHSTDDELSAKMSGRNAGAINTLRGFIHNFHTRGNISGLSKSMIARLEKGYWTCPKCLTKVQKYGYPSSKGWIP